MAPDKSKAKRLKKMIKNNASESVLKIEDFAEEEYDQNQNVTEKVLVKFKGLTVKLCRSSVRESWVRKYADKPASQRTLKAKRKDTAKPKTNIKKVAQKKKANSNTSAEKKVPTPTRKVAVATTSRATTLAEGPVTRSMTAGIKKPRKTAKRLSVTPQPKVKKVPIKKHASLKTTSTKNTVAKPIRKVAKPSTKTSNDNPSNLAARPTTRSMIKDTKKPREATKKLREAAKKPREAAKKPREATKKPREAAKKPREAAKKPREAAKKPAGKPTTRSTKKPQNTKKTAVKRNPTKVKFFLHKNAGNNKSRSNGDRKKRAILVSSSSAESSDVDDDNKVGKSVEKPTRQQPKRNVSNVVHNTKDCAETPEQSNNPKYVEKLKKYRASEYPSTNTIGKENDTVLSDDSLHASILFHSTSLEDSDVKPEVNDDIEINQTIPDTISDTQIKVKKIEPSNITDVSDIETKFPVLPKTRLSRRPIIEGMSKEMLESSTSKI